MRRIPGSIRNKLLVACVFAAGAVLATPAAMARGYHGGHGDRTADVVGALVVGAVIGGVLASASQHHDYYRGGYYYPSRPYPSGYYGSYPAYSYGSYPSYAYNDGYYYPPAAYGSRVNIGVVYSNHGYRGSSRNYGYRGNYRGHRSHGYSNRSHGNRGGRGHYYQRRGH